MKKLIIISLGFIILIGASILSGLLPNYMDNSMDDTAESRGQIPLYWVAPMDANYRRTEPGLSPMGMELIPVYEEQGGDNNSIRISPAIQQNLGLRTARVIREDFSRVLSTVGYTRWDESSIQMLYPRAEGWLEVFNLASVGDTVEAGQVIYELFAPNLVSAQREYLTASRSNNSVLATAAYDRLLALGFTRTQITELDQRGEIQNRLTVRAERTAIVTEIGVREGSYVQAHSMIATLASLNSIWIDTEIFETDAGLVQQGLLAMVSFPAFPGEVWQSQVAYVYPELDRNTRTLRLRLLINNADQKLRPNMFANVSIEAKPRLSVLTVPREAVIRSGAGDRVILALPEGRFQAQAMVTGISNGARIEIISGLSEGDLVVSSGQFLLDAEANGEQSLARLTSTEEPESVMIQ